MNHRYSHCPRKPEGFKWEGFARGNYGQACWGFDTFAEALAYLRSQWQHAKNERHPQDFRGRISGPGGAIEWNTIAALVQS